MSTKEEFKAGHPRAIRAGGMRISQHQRPNKTNEVRLNDPELNNAALKVSTSPEKAVNISGAPIRGNIIDFPTEAVQCFHNKPQPCHEPNTSQKPYVIHQPRKM